MSEFDAEVKNSLRGMQEAVAATTAKVEKLDKTLRSAAESAKSVAKAHTEGAHAAGEHGKAVERLEEGIEGSRKSARLLGGEAGTLAREFTELARNPWALTAGAAFGLIGAAAEKAIESVKELMEEEERAAKLGEAAFKGKQATEKGAIDQTNVQEERRRAFEAEGGPTPSISLVPAENRKTVLQAADQAVSAGSAKTQEEFVAKLVQSQRAGLDAFEAYAREQKAVTGATGLGPNASRSLASRLVDEKNADHTRAPDVERAANPFAGKSPAQLAVLGTGSEFSAGEFEERLRRAEQSETGRLARIVEQRKAAEERSQQSARVRGLRSAAGEAGGLTTADIRKQTPELDEELKKSEAKVAALRKQAREEESNGGASFFKQVSRIVGFAPDTQGQIEKEQAHARDLIGSAQKGIDHEEGAATRESILKQAEAAAQRQEKLIENQIEEARKTNENLRDVIDAVKTEKDAKASANAQVQSDIRLNAALSEQATRQNAAATEQR